MWVAALLALAMAVGAGSRELDPGACARRFDVQPDKIIRTEESREMGARYLSELDVGARAECLRLCCETDACDVFVYEEKSPGSCYLFSCGPPEDFRCKFTAHSNFSSGVLALSRRLAELQDQERAAARPPHAPPPARHPAPPPAPPSPAPIAPAAPSAPSAPPTTPSTPSTTSTPVRPPTLAPPAPTPSITSRRCSRYQFECRSGECIAVYNACDGVPQCRDGSDEPPGLACPPAPAAPAAPPQPQRPVAPPQESYMAEAEAEGPRWPHRLTQAQPPLYSEGGAGGAESAAPHIFSHKGGLLQPPYAPAWPRRLWPQPPASGVAEWGGWRNEWDTERGWPPPPPRLDTLQDLELGAGAGARAGEVPEFPGGAGRAPHIAPKKGPPPPAPPPAPEPRTPPAPHPTDPPPPPSTTQPVKEVHLPLSAADAHAHEGRSERPPAALLLLVLGVAMTGALAVLGACRARHGRRRRRRGLAHDADYLVNGMYL